LVQIKSVAAAPGEMVNEIRRDPASVIAGLDPAIHADWKGGQPRRIAFIHRTSAWITGSSPVMTRLNAA
jgi:hypothetical protein